MSRWIRVQTAIFDHELFQAEPLTEREAVVDRTCRVERH
jgi:hypothetical protein